MLRHKSAFLQEWKLNIDAADYENNMEANMYKPSKNNFNRIDDHEHWPGSIKSTIQWFPFHIIMEHTENIMQDDKHLILSLIKMFSMFERCLGYGENIWTLCL